MPWNRTIADRPTGGRIEEVATRVRPRRTIGRLMGIVLIAALALGALRQFDGVPLVLLILGVLQVAALTLYSYGICWFLRRGWRALRRQGAAAADG